MCISDLINKGYKHFLISVSSHTIHRVLKDFRYTMKSVVPVPKRKSNERTLNLKEEYAAKFRHLESTSEHKNFIFLDEVGFSVVSLPRRGRSKQGTLPMLQFLQLKAEIFQS